MDTLKIHVEEVKHRRITLDETVEGASLPSLAALESSGEAVVVAPVSVRAVAEWEYDHVRVAAEASTRLKLACSRCLADFEAGIDTAFTVFYRKGDPRVPEEGELELSSDDLVAASFRGEEIDLAPEIGEQLVMEIPIKPLCSDSCRGLCVLCGADLNRGDCGCSRETGDLRFSVLKNLKPQQ